MNEIMIIISDELGFPRLPIVAIGTPHCDNIYIYYISYMYIFIVNNGLPQLYPATKLLLFFSKGDYANDLT